MDDENISEESLRKFLAGAKLNPHIPIRIYPNQVQIWLENEAFLSISATLEGEIKVDLIGPSAPDREWMRDVWDEDVCI
jgi:hypothetical protein